MRSSIRRWRIPARQLRITLPELPDSETIADTYDLQTFLRAPRRCAQPARLVGADRHVPWAVLVPEARHVQGPRSEHRAHRCAPARSAAAVPRRKRDVRAARQRFATCRLICVSRRKARYQVVDADSSQMRAAAAVVNGHDLVIEGPPGTGKSQTITNLDRAGARRRQVGTVRRRENGRAGSRAPPARRRRPRRVLPGAPLVKGQQTRRHEGTVGALDASLQPVAGAAGAGKRLPEVRRRWRITSRPCTRPSERSACRRTPRRELGLVLAGAQDQVHDRDQRRDAERRSPLPTALCSDLAVHARAHR